MNFMAKKIYLHFPSIWHIIVIEIYYLIKLFKFNNYRYKNWLNLTIVFLIKIVYNNNEPDRNGSEIRSLSKSYQ